MLQLIPRRLLRTVTLAALVGLLATTLAPSALSSGQSHCVFMVEDVAEDGELLTADPVCFATLTEAASYASGGTLRLPAGATGADLPAAEAARRALGGSQTMSGSYYAVHFVDPNGEGTSATIYGLACTGGESWHVSATFDNNIESTFNACSVTRHYDYENYSGTMSPTYGQGQTRNLGWFANRPNSIKYGS